MVRVLHIISGDIWAGAEYQVFQLLCNLNKNDDLSVVCIIFNNGLLKDNLEKQKIETILLDETKYNSLHLFLRLRVLICSIDPHIVHVHKVKEHFLGWLSRLFGRKRFLIVRTLHGMSIVANSLQWLQHIRSRIVVSLDKFSAVWLTDAVITVSRDMSQLVYLQKIGKKVYQINNGICMELSYTDDERTIVRKRYGADNTFWIGTTVRLVDVKNLPMLIKSALYLHQINIPLKVSIFGDGPLKQDLKQLIMSFGLEHVVVLHGFEYNIDQVIMSLDAFVLCSLHEGLPMSLLQSMYLMTPVVCTAVGGMKEVISDGINGILVPVNDNQSLSNALIKLYNDKSLRSKLAKNARETVESQYSCSNMAQAVIDLYGNLLGRA